MTMQEAFDFVARKLIEQGRQSVSSGACVYRGDKGTKCAVGWLIPDEEYEPKMQYISSVQVIRNKVSALRKYPYTFLVALQDAHDSCAVDFPRQIKDELRNVADEFGLDAGVLA